MFTSNHDGTYTARSLCSCGRTTEANVSSVGVFAYNRGAHAQSAFPELSAGQREALFISGTCDDCWNAMFLGLDPDYSF